MGVTLIGFQSASLLGAASIIVNPCMFCYRAGHSLAGRDNRRPSLKLLSLHLPPPPPLSSSGEDFFLPQPKSHSLGLLPNP